MRVSRVIPILLSAGLVSAACGSDEEPESSGKGGAGTGGSTGATGGASTGGASGSGGTGGASATGGGSGTGGDAGTTGGTGGDINDGSAGTTDGSAGTGGSAGAPNAEVHCGTQMAPTTCSGGQVCCYVFPGADYCSAANACECLDGGQCIRVAIPCDGPEDCASGQVCCGTLNTADAFIPSYTRISCQATCNTANNEFEFCHAGDAGNTACKEAGTTCRGSTYLQGFQICAPAG